LENDVKQATRLINKCPRITLDDEGATALFNFLTETTTLKQTKRYLKQFSACLTWAKRRKIINDNPYPDLIKTISTKKRNEDTTDINPFTIEERDRIIEAFRTGEFERFKGSHTKYADYIEFNFLTGARTSEALGLKWEHIDFEKNIIVFQEGRVLATNGGYKKGVQKKGLKTQSSRVFTMNKRISNLLLKRKEETSPFALENNVFKDVNHASFREHAYKKVLDCLDIEYRKPYQTRHSFITIMANQSSLKMHQIAKICGTSMSVIESHYLDKNSGIKYLPEI
jgi:integrase